ncbi:hypothetical protein MSU_0764 [Mycoplasma suis str. Illinois]|uniref:Uncharacterized protein n=1 Tax=Mycoplasma suis (strain Illinois) TaxID=768700 RepID=F0QS19_MYCSL|nr:hypothetical protein MSU_0764 [Mycoplasma suis str. Illinois]
MWESFRYWFRSFLIFRRNYLFSFLVCRFLSFLTNFFFFVWFGTLIFWLKFFRKSLLRTFRYFC